VLKDFNQVLDIGRDDLEEIFLQTEMRAITAALARPCVQP
jgi:CBS-domain-containing membrane protein